MNYELIKEMIRQCNEYLAKLNQPFKMILIPQNRNSRYYIETETIDQNMPDLPKLTIMAPSNTADATRFGLGLMSILAVQTCYQDMTDTGINNTDLEQYTLYLEEHTKGYAMPFGDWLIMKKKRPGT